MGLDKVDGDVGQSARVVDAGAGPWLGHLLGQDAKPVAVDGLLLLESSLEHLEDVAHGEGADGRAAD